MTTHWIISIGRPKLPVISGKAILTALSRGTTDVPRPISTSRSHCLAVIPGHAVERVSAREPGSVFTTAIVAEERCSERSFRGKIFASNSSWDKIPFLSFAYDKVGAVLRPLLRGTLTAF